MIAMLHRFVFPGLIPLLFVCLAAEAQVIVADEDSAPAVEPDIAAETEDELEVPEDSLSGSYDDSSGSIEATREAAADIRKQGWQISGDMRVGYIRAEQDLRDGSSDTDTNWRGRFRIGGTSRFNSWLLGNVRIASTCSSDRCDPEFVLDHSLPTGNSIEDGDITFDELYLHAFRLKRFDLAVGRLQTKFVTRSGVFAKSLDRNDSNGFNVNWTDGAHGTYHSDNGAITHLILQYNDPDGPSNVRRRPLDFADSDSRVTYFFAWESQKRIGPITQRGIDITYMPSSMLKDGAVTGPVDDYVGIVSRFTTARPIGTSGRRWNFSAELGYAPETPTRRSLNLPGEGDVDGFAWAVTGSLMDLWPNHSVGINYARADAGWLLSPQYRNNEELVEIRYLWRKRRNLALDMRVRWRRDLVQQALETQKRDEVDFFARFTVGFSR